MAGGTTFIGILSTMFGVWLLDSAVKNRPPIETLKLISTYPKNIPATLKATNGTYAPIDPTTTGYTKTGTTVPSTTPSGSTNTPGGVSAGSSAAASAVSWARQQIGKPYVYGATGPNSYDCSGLIQAAYRTVGVSLPRTTYQQVLVGVPVSKANLAIGDLVFPDPGHVQLYSGGGNVVEAPRTGLRVREVKMWGFWTARRIVSSNQANGTIRAV
jgi:cell wall-associated NlpC family hydrolase